MPRGFKVCHTSTGIARIQGFVKDARSFASTEKAIEGEWDGRPHVHLILYGKDKVRIRAMIFRRNREENGGQQKCWKCGCRV